MRIRLFTHQSSRTKLVSSCDLCSNKTIDAHEHVSFQTIAWLIHRGVHILPENLVLRVQNEWEPKRDDLLLVAAKEYSKDNDAKIVLNYLLSQNIDINTVSRSRNCLKIAIMNDDVEFVSLLLDHGANVEKLPGLGMNPLIEALWYPRSNSERVCQLLLTHRNSKDVIDVNCFEENVSCDTALQFAAKHGYTNTMELLLSFPNIDINSSSRAGWTPFISACAECNSFCVQLILQKAVTENILNEVISHTTKKNENGLMWVCRVNTLESLTTVDSLLNYAAHCDSDIVNVSNEDGSTPLHFAASKGSFAICQSLCAAAANVNTRNNNGSTPLHLACSAAGDEFLIRHLLKWKANMYAIDSRGHTPFHLCILNQRVDLMRAFLLDDDVDEDHVKIKPYDVNKALCDEGFMTPDPVLITAVNQNDLNIVKFLIDSCGADLDTVSPRNHFSPIQHACRNNNYKMVELLMNKGASLNLESLDGSLPCSISDRRILNLFKGRG